MEPIPDNEDQFEGLYHMKYYIYNKSNEFKKFMNHYPIIALRRPIMQTDTDRTTFGIYKKIKTRLHTCITVRVNTFVVL